MVPAIDSGVTVVYFTGHAALLLKSTIETFAPVPESALRNALVAFFTVSVWPDDAIEPDSSRTNITLIPHRGGRFGFAPGSRDPEGVLELELRARVPRRNRRRSVT